MKIAIIGYSGSGKSTLAGKLGKKHGIPVLYLDTVHWLPGWKERCREEKERIVADFLDTNESWVIDGNYTRLWQERRLSEADIIIFMAFNRFACLSRIIKRYRMYKGVTRDSMTEGCPEKIDRQFAKWVLWEGRSKKHRQHYKAILRQYSHKIVVIKNQYSLTAYECSQGLTT